METAKVDIKKLQMLNDRIAQTIEALNQVRLSVHGISHTAGVGVINPLLNPFTNPYAAQTAGINNVYGSPYAQGIQGMVPGFGHTTGLGFNGYNAFNPAAQIWGATNPFANQNVFGAQNPFVQANPFLATNGLGHTTAENYSERAYDPFWTQRLQQTFPFAQWGYSPFATQGW